METNVQYIACVNNAGFVMNFSVQWLSSDGTWQTSTWNSGNYPINQSQKSPDLASIGVPGDALAVTPVVNAVLGGSHQGTPFAGYQPNGQTATYEVQGTTLNFSVTKI